MYDVEIIMENRPGQLALMGETLGAAGISVEGGGELFADSAFELIRCVRRIQRITLHCLRFSIGQNNLFRPQSER